MMIIKAHNTKSVEIKDKWEELTPEEYLFVVNLMAVTTDKQIDIDSFRQIYLMYITHYKPSKKLTPEELEEVESNMYLLSQQINFFFKQNDEGRTEFNINFTKNLLPEFRFKRKKFIGPEFYLSELGDIRTNLTADPFIDAQEYYNLYLRTKQPEALDMLVAVLYGKYKNGYSTLQAQKQGEYFATLDFNIKYAVYIFFRALLSLIVNRTHLGILFRKHQSDNDTHESKISLGLIDTVYSLVKSGYGTQKEVGRMIFTDYLAALLKEIKDSIQAKLLAGKKPFDIAKETGMPFEIINQLS